MKKLRQKKISRPKSKTKPILLSQAFLNKWPLPSASEKSDKDARGRVLIVGGAKGMPGPVILSATAALRSGAGKLTIATPKSLAPWVAMSVVESLVIELPERKNGALAPSAARKLSEILTTTDALLIGPGMTGGGALSTLLKLLLAELKDTLLVIDAEALKFFGPNTVLPVNLRGRVVITPHAGEMATILNLEKSFVEANPEELAVSYAQSSGAVVVLKGPETFIASPLGDIYRNRAGNVGLAISGSGDTLAGIIAGLCARGASAVQAAAWGVHLHASAGDRLAKKIGRIGYLPRELLLEVPKIMAGIF